MSHAVTACPACAASEIVDLPERDGYPLRRCGACGLLWVHGVEGDSALKFYDREYFQGDKGYQDYHRDEPLLRRDARRLLAVARKAGGLPGSLLDVGCAYGFMLDEAREQGWEVQGIEPSPGPVGHACGSLGLKVFQGDWEHAGLQARSFTLLFCIGVIEHLSDFPSALAEFHRLMVKDGLLLLTTVDTGRFPWLYRIKPPEHLTYFSSRSLSRALDRAGFRIESCDRHWTWYRLDDFIYNGLRTILEPPKALRRCLPGIPILLPTNETLICARAR